MSAIAGTIAGIANPGFAYDANGNLLEGLGRRYGWSSFNIPATIDKLSAGVPVQRSAFVFGPEHQRLRQTQSPMSGGAPGAPTTTVHYAGAMHKEIDAVANTTTIRTYLRREGAGCHQGSSRRAGVRAALGNADPCGFCGHRGPDDLRSAYRRRR